jgi:hypothetical protein
MNTRECIGITYFWATSLYRPIINMIKTQIMSSKIHVGNYKKISVGEVTAISHLVSHYYYFRTVAHRST